MEAQKDTSLSSSFPSPVVHDQVSPETQGSCTSEGWSLTPSPASTTASAPQARNSTITDLPNAENETDAVVQEPEPEREAAIPTDKPLPKPSSQAALERVFSMHDGNLIPGPIRMSLHDQLQMVRWCVDNSDIYRKQPRNKFYAELRAFLTEVPKCVTKEPQRVLSRLVKTHRRHMQEETGVVRSERDLDRLLDQWIKIIDDDTREKDYTAATQNVPQQEGPLERLRRLRDGRKRTADEAALDDGVVSQETPATQQPENGTPGDQQAHSIRVDAGVQPGAQSMNEGLQRELHDIRHTIFSLCGPQQGQIAALQAQVAHLNTQMGLILQMVTDMRRGFQIAAGASGPMHHQ